MHISRTEWQGNRRCRCSACGSHSVYLAWIGKGRLSICMCTAQCAGDYLLCLCARLCPILCNPMDHSSPGSSVHEDFPGKNTGVGCHALLQGIFPTQGSNPGLLHCRWILYPLSHHRHPRIPERVSYSIFSGSSWPRNWAGVSCIAGGFFTSWATREAPFAWYNILYSLPFISYLAFSFLSYT